MEGMKELMQRIASTKKIELIQDSRQCETHLINLISLGGNLKCPRCFLEGENAKDDKMFMDELKRREETANDRFLASNSVIEDETIKLARFDNYEVQPNTEEYINKQKCIDIADRYKQGEVFNTFLVSPITGVGKSHLGMAILKECNGKGTKNLFIDVSAMLRKIRASFSDKESKYTEQYFIDLCSQADLLLLDDLGAETGDIGTYKKASDYTSNVLRAIMNNRQTKSTIVTTNLGSKDLEIVYDRKLVSRMLRNISVIKFENSKDKRSTSF